MQKNPYHPPIVFHPGETLAEKLEELGMDARTLAAEVGLSESVIQGLLNGSVSVVTDTAMRLERALGIPARFWLKMQEEWDAFYTP
jgi:addiction module HigA family antidote